jgi:flagellar biosynthesis/type III secretory pathway chaperone
MKNDTGEVALNRLVDLLEREERLCMGLISLCRREKTAIVHWRTEELKVCASEKESLMLELDDLQEHRGRTLNELRVALSLDGRATLPELSGMVEEPFSSRLHAGAFRLAAAAKHLAELNEKNEGLLADGIRLIRGAYELLKKASGFPTTYQPTGRICSHGESGRLLRGTA